MELFFMIAILTAGSILAWLQAKGYKSTVKVVAATACIGLIAAYCYFTTDGLATALLRIFFITLAAGGIGTIEREKGASTANENHLAFAALWLFMLLGTYCKMNPSL